MVNQVHENMRELDLLGQKLKQLAREHLQTGNYKELSEISGLLEEIEKLKSSYGSIQKRLSVLSSKDASTGSGTSSAGSKMRASKKRAKKARAQLLSDLKDQNLDLGTENGALYSFPDSNKSIGIAFASEATKDKWFLGLPDENYQGVAFLCEQQNGAVRRFLVGRKFFETHRTNFSYSSQGSRRQYKFNIYKRKSGFVLRLRNGVEINLDRFEDDFRSLLGH